MVAPSNSSKIIGRKTYLDFPAFGLNDVPAKVDTGADSSAIWASNITEKKGTLRFTLFDVASQFYTGKVIQTKDYKIISIKNSFGVAEFRYKVLIPIRLEGRDIKVRFTLADRSNSSQPVLIGRRTLQGKFVVDVAVDPDVNKKKHVLFVSARLTDSVKQLTEKLQSDMQDTIVDLLTYDDMIFSLKNGVSSVRIDSTGRDLAEYNLIHFKTSLLRDITAAYARYASKRGVRILDPIIESYPTTSKLYQYSILADNDILVPDSIFVTPKKLIGSFELFRSSLSLPFVLKGIHASKGDLNDVINDEADFDRIAADALQRNEYLIGQKFVPNVGDYRVLTMGKQIKLVIHRFRKDESTHLNNTSAGSIARLVPLNELPPEIKFKSLQMAELLGRDITGIDMVQHSKTKRWYCFEVNDGPQIATGAYKEEKQQALAEYLQRELEK